ncbi:MAG: SdpI family protein [Candidatus Cloacimonetes bacterium]|nr:SdpI family protein [Candidatus Cloacimonadota bacterium]
MKRIRNYRGSLILIVLYLVALVYFILALPADAKVPMHWNAEGEIDNFYSKTGAAVFGIGMSLGLFLLIYLMPWYSPKYRNHEQRFERILPGLSFILVLFFSLISIYSFMIALYQRIIPINFIFVLLGLLFIFLGNLLPKVPRNFFIGIRTPWTLADEDNWFKTHRLGAYMFVISGVLLILKGVVWQKLHSFQNIVSVMAIVLVLYPLLYSFLIYRRKRS